jgi:hypothetical protein
MQPETNPDTSEQSSETTEVVTLENEAAEALRLIAMAEKAGLTLRLLGGVAIRLRSPQAATHRALARTYADLDFAAPRKESRALRDMFATAGYTADRRFNALHGDRRLLFYDASRERQVDIFLGVFEMCHKLVLEDRLLLHPQTLSPADLLLTKLQIVELNAKDTQDALALLLDIPPLEPGGNPGEAMDVARIVDICSHNWGWYTTVEDNLQRIATSAQQLLSKEDADTVQRRLEIITAALDRAPKSAAWQLRAAVGRRVLWYELPEEVRR